MAADTPPNVAVVDYGAGNLRSVTKALERSGLAPRLASKPGELRGCEGLVLPGVGAFPDAAAALDASGLGEAVLEAIDGGAFYLGLCLGLQLLFDESEEHRTTAGFGRLPGTVRRFPDHDTDGTRLLVPHIGWNEVRFRGDHPMIELLPERDAFYFVHGYRAVPARATDVVGTAGYGGEFAAAVARERVFAVQFHPEKSQNAGRRLLDAYRTWIDGARP